MTRISRASRRRGTTLLELVVALVVTGAMATIGTSAFAQLVDRRRTVHEAGAETERAAALRTLLREWFAVATIERPDEAGAAGAARSAVGSDDLYFRTSALVPGAVPGSRLRLYVDDDPDTPEQGLTLEYRATPAAPWQRRQLDERLTGLGIDLFDGIGAQWVAAATASGQRPVAVRLRFPAPPGAERLWQLSLTIPVLAGGDATGAAP